MGQLTTHVLDTANGCTGSGIRIELRRGDGNRDLLATCTTNSDGRCDQPLLSGDDFVPGVYEIMFRIGPYYARLTQEIADPPFLDEVVIRFGIASQDEHYHVPLLVSPWAYSTYRGS
jgi:5-hydroxyisourate hydrolase